MTSSRIRNKAERNYAKLLESKKIVYIYQPKVSSLGILNYTPDFYLIKKNIFVEIIGSRQAFHQNKIRLADAIKIINLEILKENGEKYNYNFDLLNSTRRSHRSITFLLFDIEKYLLKNQISFSTISKIIECRINSIIYMIENKKVNLKYIEKIKLYEKSNPDAINISIKEMLPEHMNGIC